MARTCHTCIQTCRRRGSSQQPTLARLARHIVQAVPLRSSAVCIHGAAECCVEYERKAWYDLLAALPVSGAGAGGIDCDAHASRDVCKNTEAKRHQQQMHNVIHG
jgi:hypothetical protein